HSRGTTKTSSADGYASRSADTASPHRSRSCRSTYRAHRFRAHVLDTTRPTRTADERNERLPGKPALARTQVRPLSRARFRSQDPTRAQASKATACVSIRRRRDIRESSWTKRELRRSTTPPAPRPNPECRRRALRLARRSKAQQERRWRYRETRLSRCVRRKARGRMQRSGGAEEKRCGGAEERRR